MDYRYYNNFNPPKPIESGEQRKSTILCVYGFVEYIHIHQNQITHCIIDPKSRVLMHAFKCKLIFNEGQYNLMSADYVNINKSNDNGYLKF